MKINELTITKDLNAARDPSDLEDIMQQHGWKVLGSGAEAAVAEHPDKQYVLKVFEKTSRYIDFVHFALENQSNPHVPKFNSHVKQIPNTPYNYVRMEKLTKTNNSKLISDHISDMYALVVISNDHSIQIHSSLPNEVETYLDAHYGIDDIRMYDKRKFESNFLKIGKKADPSWIQICNSLMDYCNAIGFPHLDLHGANFMMRGNTVVILDPFIEKAGSE
jgi:hypothetical protein